MRSFRKDKRGVSNAIVFVLGLVIVTVIVANVFLWNFEMNQLDWEKMQEDVDIVSVTSIIDTWSYNPSGYILGGSTSNVSGSVSDLTSNDGVYMTFRSYYSGTDTSDFVDQTCDLYSPSAKGTHSNFTAQQYGPDSIYDMLTEGGIGGGTVWLWQEDTSGYSSIGSYETYQFWSSWTTNATTSGTVTKIGIYVFADPGNSPQVKLGIYDDSGGSPNNLLGQTDATTITGAGWLDLDIVGGGVSISPNTTYHVAHITDIAPTTQWRYRKTATPVSRYRTGRVWPNLFNPAGTTFTSISYRYGAYRVGYYDPSNYRLDLEVQWTNASYTHTNEELCIKTGTTGTEDIKVDVWNGSEWINVFTDLTPNSWNNVSVTSYLNSSTFTIRFKDGNETGDTTQDSWNIDVTLLHVWSNQYAMEVDFIGSSNTEDWTQLAWVVDSAWTIGSVDVTVQLYNYTLGGYPTSGNGYMSYTSNATANTDETKSQNITVNPTQFRNATGYWKIKVKGVKATDTQFDFKADWIEFKPVKAGGTLFTFENSGSLTCHLVSLWVINSTVHRHYDIDVFINSGDTCSYVRYDINLPDGQFLVKVVTERGNMEVYSID